jgi:predicted membrane protein
MNQPIVSKKRAQSISFSLFLVFLGILGLTKYWMPGILLAIGIPLALRQYLMKKPYDVFVTLLVFIGGFISMELDFSWNYTFAVIFILSGIYVFFREFFESKTRTIVEEEENLNEEIEEEQHP